MSDVVDVFRRHFANAAGMIADSVEHQPEGQDTFEAMDGHVTVVRDEHGADVILHDRDMSVHVRFGDPRN